jgi:hypothetical protein
MSDWFRKETWSEEDKEHFFEKLGRAREWGRPQYVRIQIVTFDMIGLEKNIDGVSELLEYYMEHYFGLESDLSNSQITTITAKLALLVKDSKKALSIYKSILDLEDKKPNLQTDTYLEYADVIIFSKKKDMYSDLYQIILSRLKWAVFPIQKFSAYSYLAFLDKSFGNEESFENYLQLANLEKDKTDSGFAFHKKLGLVKKDNLLKRLFRSL